MSVTGAGDRSLHKKGVVFATPLVFSISHNLQYRYAFIVFLPVFGNLPL